MRPSFAPRSTTRTEVAGSGARVALVANSDGRWPRSRPEIDSLASYLRSLGLEVALSPAIFSPELPPAGELRPHNWMESAPDVERARVLEGFFTDPSIAAIVDVSGGSLANGVLSHLDLGVVRANPKPFVGYSDLSVLVNALHAATGREQYWWQARHLVDEGNDDLRERFAASFVEAFAAGSAPSGPLFDLSVQVVRGESMTGRLVGGNLACFLKLAGTPHFPDVTGAIVAIESLSGESGAVYTGYHQLRQLGVFRRAAGILLGQHTRLTELAGEDAARRIALDVVDNPDLPIAVTQSFGHSADSRALAIGREYSFQR